MARYIDAEALTAEFKRLSLGENSLIERIFADGVYAVIDTFPTADVVPKSEVDDLKNKLKETEIKLMNVCLDKTNCDEMIEYILDVYFNQRIKEVFDEIEALAMSKLDIGTSIEQLNDTYFIEAIEEIKEKYGVK